MHYLSNRLRGDVVPDLVDVMGSLAEEFDGAYNIAFLDGFGRMFLSRDPLGFHPISYGVADGWFVAANESVALYNLDAQNVRHLDPGEMVIVEDGKIRVERYTDRKQSAKCFFEWVYFAHAGSEIDGEGVYKARLSVGRALAENEAVPFSAVDTIVVPVPDTAKPAADAFAFGLGLPCVEGVLRNRYVGRTFIEPESGRREAARSKYTVVREVLEGKRVFLIEDSIVRSLTLRVLVDLLRNKGRASEIHVRVASPPIVAPCFYGVNMSTTDELFAPPFLETDHDGTATPTMLKEMAAELGVDSLRFLRVDELGKTIGVEQDDLCLACVTRNYPTPAGLAAFAAIASC